jgi:hypothetical protein
MSFRFVFVNMNADHCKSKHFLTVRSVRSKLAFTKQVINNQILT